MRRWLREELTLEQRHTLGVAMNEILQNVGIAVCDTKYGKQLGGGLFEFRLRDEPNIVLRVFCHAHGARLILLLAGYDKAADPSRKRQQSEIAIARARLDDWKRRTRS